MTVTFQSDSRCPTTTERVPCCCAQMAPDFMNAPAHVLRSHAEADCYQCMGQGSHLHTERVEPMLNVCNVNAHALLRLLELDSDSLEGVISLPLMRRALIRARSSFDRRVLAFERPGHEHRTAREHDGVRVLTTRAIEGGLSRERLADYLRHLERLCLFGAEHGATRIFWN